MPMASSFASPLLGKKMLVSMPLQEASSIQRLSSIRDSKVFSGAHHCSFRYARRSGDGAACRL